MAILDEFHSEYGHLKTGNRLRCVQNQVECPHAGGAIEGKHIAMKKPKRYGSEYYNYKGQVLGQGGSLSDSQTFNCSK